MFKSHSLKSTSSRLLGSLLFATLAWSAQPASAGHWEVSQYRRGAQSHEEYWVLGPYYANNSTYASALAQGVGTLDAKVRFRPLKNNHLVTVTRHDGRHELAMDGSQESSSSYFHYFDRGDSVSIDFGPPGNFPDYHLGYPHQSYPTLSPTGTTGARPGKASGALSIQAVLVWVPGQIQDPQTHQAVDDPADIPPADVYFVEDAQITGYVSDDTQTTSPFQFNGIECPLNDSEDFPVQYTVTPFGYNLTNHLKSGKRLIHKDNPLHLSVINGEVRQFKGTIDLQSTYVKDELVGRAGSANLRFDYQLVPVNFSLAWNEGQNPMAAGALPTPVHQGKFKLTFKDNNGQNIGEVPLDLPLALPKLKVEVVDRGFGPTDVVTAQVMLEGKKTDSNGQIEGTFTSGNRVEATTIGIRKKLDNGTKGVFASLVADQLWASVEWKLGAPLDPNAPPVPADPTDTDGSKAWAALESWGAPFLVGTEGYSKEAYAKLKTVADKPLVGHGFKFLVDYLEVKEDVRAGDPITKIFTTDPTQVGLHAGDAAYQVVYQPDVTALTSKYITPPADATSDKEGVVKGRFTVKAGDSFTLNSFRFGLEDQGVYVR